MTGDVHVRVTLLLQDVFRLEVGLLYLSRVFDVVRRFYKDRPLTMNRIRLFQMEGIRRKLRPIFYQRQYRIFLDR
jgi:hypothetical protein